MKYLNVEADFAKKQNEEVLRWYDNMQKTIPTWYLKDYLIQKTFEEQVGSKIRAIHQFENVQNNSVYKIETDTKPYIFKVYTKRDWPEDGKLPFINQKLNDYKIPHAKMLIFNRDDNSFSNGFLIEECLPGTTADSLCLSKHETMSLFEKLGNLISKIHGIELSGYGYIGNGNPAIWNTFSEFMYDVFNDNSPVIIENGFANESELRKINKTICNKIKCCDIFPPTLCHGDLSLKNVIVHSDKITLIDWDDAQSLCWVADIARLTFWMRLEYGEETAALYKTAFLTQYETMYDRNIFYEVEDILHVWYGFDYLTFFNKGEKCERIKALLHESLVKCGLENLKEKQI
ncbi:MAG: aminoglycoside phosphotransferase family protein [Oscillospiraceae bacterium]|nr:aminoglycoside phosphotransferase family protein [Oscillospiraceae bacterium]